MSQSELTTLCDEIKRLLPPSSMIDPTEQLTEFIKDLRSKGINESELVAIQRAYNYFNRMIGQSQVMAEPKNKPVNKLNQGTPLKNQGAAIHEEKKNEDLNESISTEEKEEKEFENPEEMIELLVQVFEATKDDLTDEAKAEV